MEAHTSCWAVGLMITTTFTSKTSRSTRSPFLSTFWGGVYPFLSSALFLRPSKYEYEYLVVRNDPKIGSCIHVLPWVSVSISELSEIAFSPSCYVAGVFACSLDESKYWAYVVLAPLVRHRMAKASPNLTAKTSAQTLSKNICE